jgi:hypothetical protein
MKLRRGDCSENSSSRPRRFEITTECFRNAAIESHPDERGSTDFMVVGDVGGAGISDEGDSQWRFEDSDSFTELNRSVVFVPSDTVFTHASGAPRQHHQGDRRGGGG